jgi:poly(3-hydroxybutyrate) depolymerase
MKYSTPFLLTLMLLPFQTTAASGKVVKESITSQNKKRAFYLFVPESINSAQPASLIVLLHGSGRNGLTLVDKWKDLADREGIILVGPDSMNPSVWSSPVDGPDFLRDLVENIKSRFTIDPRRVYLFGHSGGAVFALYMSLLESQYFAAVAIHAGALRPRDPAIGVAKRKSPIAIFVGTRDRFFPLEDVRGTRDDLTKQGFAVELTEIPGHDHNYYDLAPNINKSAWEFLKKYQLDEDPHYEQYNWNR